MISQREAAELRLMNWLNDQKLQGANGLYDFGELGVLWIYWKGHWETRWVELKQPPFLDEKEQ